MISTTGRGLACRMHTSYSAQDGPTTTGWPKRSVVSWLRSSALGPRDACGRESEHPGTPALMHISGRTQGGVEGGKGGEVRGRSGSLCRLPFFSVKPSNLRFLKWNLALHLCEVIFIKS